MSLSIRLALLSDLHSIVTIYNQAILKKGLTADLDLQDVSEKTNWFEQHKPERYPIFVATKNNEVVGWVSLSPYREGRRALQGTSEVSLYLDENHIGKGYGSIMMTHIMAEAKQLGYTTIIAILIANNQKSVGLFTKFNFVLWGLLPGIVEIGDEKLNHCIYGRPLL
jgi:L-amino acid N-acyltransferase YncA